MPELLFELFSEEIPARMQRRAADDLKKLVTDALVERGFLYENARSYFTPRRLALVIDGLPMKGADTREERKGPRVDAPEKAIEGFLKSAGLTSAADARIEQDAKKGDYYVAVIEKKGLPTINVLRDILPEIIRTFPWPKSMRWGRESSHPGALRWVRPLQSILCVFGTEIEGTEIVPFEIGGIKSGNITYGHRFLAPAAITVRRFDDYAQSLEKAFVVLDCERRKDMIAHDARDLALAQGLELELVEDDALLEEVAGLVEYPQALMGQFEEEFLNIPAEVIRTTIRTNQKCFVLRKSKDADGRDILANRFILISNIRAKDGGAVIIDGNERVVRARLSDAKFFWETDQRIKLEERLPRLENIIFHEKLGNQAERVRRIVKMTGVVAPFAGADRALAERAALLSKADLLTEMVGEFPELQGLMGRYYAEIQGENPSVSRAAEDHYKPLGPSDRVPDDPVAVAVALADKLDILVGFWIINEKPTGSKDPYALRRAALGIIRLILTNKIRLPLMDAFRLAASGYDRQVGEEVYEDLLNFFIERMKIVLKEQGLNHDLIDAVFSLGNQDDLLIVLQRVEALAQFLSSDEGKDILAGYRRATNILRIEEKKDATSYQGEPDFALIEKEGSMEEKQLSATLLRCREEAGEAIADEDFIKAMHVLSSLREPVDSFFDKVTVNSEDAQLRKNRLLLLNEIRAVTLNIADFSKIEG